ncbi:hypothetical protein [Klebsiella oxytoca]|nr:hypothetical protein [Klebsiella oxytoca]UYH02826.1 hypothetical protein NQA44_16380 [Klebsiella oxytoca]
MNENNSGLLNYIELLKSHEAALKNKLLAGDKVNLTGGYLSG